MNRIRFNSNAQLERRGAAVLILVIVLLGATTAILLVMVGTSIRHRIQLRNEIQLEQTLWLLDAGIGATISKVSQEHDFETMEIKIDDDLPKYLGTVQASVVSRDDEELKVKVTAQLKRVGQNSLKTQRSRILTFDQSGKVTPKHNDDGGDEQR